MPAGNRINEHEQISMNGTTIVNDLLGLEVDDTPLWRYVQLPELLLNLGGTLRLTSVQALHHRDPTEGLPYWNDVTQNWLFEVDKHPELSYSELSQWVKEQCPVKNGSQLHEMEVFKHWQDHVRKTRYVSCFYQSPFESIAMWQLYARDGFVIQTSVNRLGDGLKDASPHLPWRISKMLYWDKANEINPDSFDKVPELKHVLLRPFLLKAREYKHENEVRLFTSADHPFGDTICVKNVRPQHWIEQIRISPEFRSCDATLLLELLRTLFSKNNCRELNSVARHSRAKALVDSEPSDFAQIMRETPPFLSP